MEKKFIHIDELVKQKLHQEKDITGVHDAWAKMEALLDNSSKKPVAGFWNKGRWIIPLVLLVVATSSIVAYNLSQDGSKETTTNTIVDTKAHYAPASASAAATTPAADNQPIDHPIYDYAKAAIAKEAQKENPASPTHQFNSSQQIAKASNTVASKHPKKTKRMPVVKNMNATLVAINEAGKVETEQPTEVVLASTAAYVPNRLPSAKPKVSAKTPAAVQLEKDLRDKKIFVDNDNNIVKRIERKVTTTNIVERRVNDPIAKQTTFINDTISVNKYKKISYIPLSTDELKIMQSMAIVRVKSDVTNDYLELAKIEMAPIRANDAAISVTQNNQLASSEKNELGDGKLKKSSEMSLLSSINNFFEIRKQFYATAFFGMNTTVNNWLPAGLQAGLGAHMWMSKSWTIGTDISYIFQPSKYTLLDKASTFTQNGAAIPTANGYLINYTETSTNKSYSVNQVQQIEIPLLVGFHTKTWSFFAGPSLNAILPMSYYKMEYTAQEEKMTTSAVPELNMASTQLQSQPKDFESRLGLGYIFGANYNLNDRFAMQLRMNQVLTDNAQTNLGRQLSNGIFTNPTFRLGIQYKLTKSKKVMFMMDEKDR